MVVHRIRGKLGTSKVVVLGVYKGKVKDDFCRCRRRHVWALVGGHED